MHKMEIMPESSLTAVSLRFPLIKMHTENTGRNIPVG
jgi:hypothetical protein